MLKKENLWNIILRQRNTIQMRGGSILLQSKTKYTVYMFLVTLFWGLTYGLTKVCLEYSSELHIISFRFFLSFITSFFVLRKKILPIQAKDLWYSFILSILLFFVFLTMTVGLKYTTASNAGFLVSLSVIFIPFFSWIINGEKPKKKIYFVLFFSFIGIALLTLDTDLQVHRGDILCLFCSILFALHVIFVGNFVRKVNPVSLGVFQFAYLALFSFVIQYPIEGLYFPKHFSFWISLCLLSVFCTSFGYILQGIAQQNISATTAGFILSLEPVISCIFGYFILKEYYTVQQCLGGIILLLSVFYISKGKEQ